MSSICGIFHRDSEPVSPETMDRMVDCFAYWQPDDTRRWVSGCVGLGHSMLRNTPESLNEQQPWTCQDGRRLTITADARIDNRDELLRQLAAPSSEWNEPDSALIVRAFEKWDTHCPEHLVGDFAFAIWEEDSRRLFCARDYLGIKLFHYYSDERRFCFSTEMKALLGLSFVPNSINADKLAEIVIKKSYNTHSTIYNAIHSLPPAHSLVVTDSRTELCEYWKPDPHREIRLARDEDYVEQYRELLWQAVHTRMRTAYPIATTLSEGIDSSTITWIAREKLKASDQNVKAFSLADYEDHDLHRRGERDYVRPFLSALPTPHEYSYREPAGFFQPSDAMFHAMDGPLRDANTDWFQLICKSAHRDNCRVLLMGTGGDQIATSHGHDYLLMLFLKGKLFSLLGELRAQKHAQHRSVRSIIMGEVLSPLFRACRGKPILFAPRRVNSESVEGRAYPLRRDIVRDHFNRMEQASAIPLRLALDHPVRANQILETFRGRYLPFQESQYAVAAANRIECRFPMLDRRLVEFCLAVPPEQHRAHGRSRRLVRRAMSGLLPDSIIWATVKMGDFNFFGQFNRNREYAPRKMAEWKSDDAVTSHLDIGQLEQLYQQCIEDQGMSAARPTFGRSFLLAEFLAWNRHR